MCTVEHCFYEGSVFKPIYSLHLLVNVVSYRKRPVWKYIEVYRAQRCISQTKLIPARWKLFQIKMKQAHKKIQFWIRNWPKSHYWSTSSFSKHVYNINRGPHDGLDCECWSLLKIYVSGSLQCLWRKENAKRLLPRMGTLGLISMCLGI